AFKLAKQYHYFRKQKPRAFKIISRETAYHGRTMGALGAFDFPGARRDLMEPAVPGHTRVPAPTRSRCPFNLASARCAPTCARRLERKTQKEDRALVAAFIAEPLMQANGVQVPPPEYFPLVREICSKYEVLFIADEVITGFGRTGEWFALNHWDVEPDIMTV